MQGVNIFVTLIATGTRWTDVLYIRSRQGSARAGRHHTAFTTMTCLLTWGAVVLLFPVIFILWLTESKQQSAKRMRKAGHTYKTIATRLSISSTTARRYALA